MPRKSYKIQEALQQRKQNEAAALDNLRVEETAYQCYFQPDSLPSPMESGVICILPLAKLSVYPNHETYFPLYNGERLDDMVESIRRYGVQTPILVWKTANKRHIIISGHNRVNASLLAGLSSIPAVVRTDLTKEGAEDLFFEMNFRQRSLADMLFSQRVLCIAAHYNLIKRQGRRSDLLGPRRTSPDTQEKSLANQLLTSPETQEKLQADAQVAQEYELTRDKVSKYCRYATLYRPLLQLMDQGKKLGQLAAYEISFIEDQSLQTTIHEIIVTTGITISVAKAKLLRSEFERATLTSEKVFAMLAEQKSSQERSTSPISVKLPGACRQYFSADTTKAQIAEIVEKALALYFQQVHG